MFTFQRNLMPLVSVEPVVNEFLVTTSLLTDVNEE